MVHSPTPKTLGTLIHLHLHIHLHYLYLITLRISIILRLSILSSSNFSISILLGCAQQLATTVQLSRINDTTLTYYITYSIITKKDCI
jgi:hypothetical protein